MDRIKQAFMNSIAGLVEAYNSEKSFREDLVIVVLFLPLAIFSDLTNPQKALLIFSLLLILIAELANTAIETLVDRISLDKHPLSRKAKDIGSSIVLLALANAALVWALVFFV